MKVNKDSRALSDVGNRTTETFVSAKNGYRLKHHPDKVSSFSFFRFFATIHPISCREAIKRSGR